LAEEKPIPYYRRNLLAFTGDTVFFVLGLSFSDPVTVLPTFARALGASAPLVGLISTLQSGGWLLPQLISANFVASKERKKPYVVWPSLLNRPMYLAVAAVTYFFGATRPALVLLAFYLCQAIFWTCDGLASVPWFDILGKAFPGRQRGRYLGISQVTGGVLAIGAGVLVRRVLDPTAGLPFPQNYSLLFLLTVAFFSLSLMSMSMIKEPIESTHTERASWGRYLPMLAATLRQDRVFRRVVAARLLAGFGGMAIPFYILYGTEGLGLGTGVVGLGLTLQIIGRILGGLLLGFGVEKMGNRFTILGGLGLTSLAPLLALALGALGGSLLDRTLVLYLYPVIFFFMGVWVNTMMWGFTNYVLDIAPPKDRTTYVGLTNTIGGLLILAPMLGGAILQFTSYVALFAVSLAIYMLAMGVSWRLPRGREVTEPF